MNTNLNFIVNSTDLYKTVQEMGKIVSGTKSTLPILDYFLFEVMGSVLNITASNLEITVTAEMVIENRDGDGKFTMPAKLFLDTLKNIPSQPLVMEIDNYTINLKTDRGLFTMMGVDPNDFPKSPYVDKANPLSFVTTMVLSGINRTLFATAKDELRPVMNGILFDIKKNNISFVASDAHKMMVYEAENAVSDNDRDFQVILPSKAANVIKSLLPKGGEYITFSADEKNAVFIINGYTVACRLVEGNYPAYKSVIPTNNDNNIVVEKDALLATLKRVSLSSNQASNLIQLSIKEGKITVSASDIDFGNSATEWIGCEHDGNDIEIGFKGSYLIEILSNLVCDNVNIKLSDPTRAGLFYPMEQKDDNEKTLALLMPMMINV